MQLPPLIKPNRPKKTNMIEFKNTATNESFYQNQISPNREYMDAKNHTDQSFDLQTDVGS